MFWGIAAAGSGLCQSAADAVKKIIIPPPLAAATFSQAIAATIGAIAIFFVRPTLPPPFFLIVIFAAAGAQALAVGLATSPGLRNSPALLGRAASLATLLLLPASALLTADQVSLREVAAILLVAAGLWALSSTGVSAARGFLRPMFSADRWRWMLLLAAIWTLIIALEKLAVQTGGVLLSLTIERMTVATLLAFLLVGKGARPRPRSLAGVLPIGAAEFGRDALLFFALALAPSAAVFAVKNVNVLLSLPVALFLFRDRRPALGDLLGAALMIAGYVLIFL